MRRLIGVALALTAVVAFAGAALGELCPKCTGKMYVENIGKCVECGGGTSSGAFKLCRKCSAKLGQCEHCRAVLTDAKAPNRAHADKVEAKLKDKTERAARPAFDLDVAAKRLGKALGGQWKQGRQEVTDSSMLQGIVDTTRDGRPAKAVYNVFPFPFDKAGRKRVFRYAWTCSAPFYVLGANDGCTVLTYVPRDHEVSQGVIKALNLSPPKITLRELRLATDCRRGFVMDIHYYGPTTSLNPETLILASQMICIDTAWQLVVIDAKQIDAILDFLVEDGFFAKAVRDGAAVDRKRPAYVLTVQGGGVSLRQDMGWDLNVVRRLEALRKVLEGDAAKAMDKLLKRLEQQKKKWQANSGKCK